MRATKETKTNKGITLIALVITIIVMLILVAVTISMSVNGGLFDYAGKAVSETNNALKAEQQLANGGIEVDGEWYNSIEEYLKGDTGKVTGWTQKGTELTNESGKKIQVGDYVNYVSGVTGYIDSNGWRVLGAENGKILLVSTNKIVGFEYWSYWENGLLQGIDLLNQACEAFGNGQYASETTTARSIKVEDVNRITGYNPRNVGVYDLQQADEGTKYSYSDYDYGDTMVFSDEFFEETGIAQDSNELPMEAYRYHVATLTNSEQVDGSPVGIDVNSPAYDMLFETEPYALATSYALEDDGCELWGTFIVENGWVGWNNEYLYCMACVTHSEGPLGVTRAVVALDEGVTLSRDDDSEPWTISK